MAMIYIFLILRCRMMKISKNNPISFETLSYEGERGDVKQTSSRKTYKYNLDTYITTELMSNSVQYAHLGKGKKNVKLLLRMINANLTDLQNIFKLTALKYKYNFRCRVMNSFLLKKKP